MAHAALTLLLGSTGAAATALDDCDDCWAMWVARGFQEDVEGFLDRLFGWVWWEDQLRLLEVGQQVAVRALMRNYVVRKIRQ